MANPLFTKKAMTIVEVIIVTTVLLVLVGAGIAPYMMQQKMLKKQFAKNAVQDEVAIPMAYIARDLFKAMSCTASADQLTVTVPTQPIQGSATETITYAYSSANQEITRQVDTQTARKIASYVTAVNFNKTANNYCEVSITAQREGETFTMRTAAALRATQAQ